MISNVAVTDLDSDGLLDVIVCDCRTNSVTWIRQYPAGIYTESILADNLIAPAHVQVIDFDNDGLMDMVTGGMHAYPPYDRMSRIVLWTNNGSLSGGK